MRARSWTLARVGEADFESISRTKFRFRLSDEGEYYRESVSRARGDKRGLDLTRLLERSFEKWILIENQSGIYLECCIMGKRVGR